MKKLFLIIIIISQACLLFSEGEPSFLAPAEEVAGDEWKPETRAQYDGGSLFGYINGGAEVFVEYGFDTVYVRKFKNEKTGSEVTLDVYVMSDSYAAEGIFLSKYGYPVESNFEAHLAIEHDQQLAFARAEYFVIISSLKKNRESRNLMKTLAGLIVSRIEKSNPIDFAILPGENLVRNSERLIRGTITLQSIYSLGEGEMLWSEKGLDAFTADYKDTDGKIYNLIIARYKTSENSARAFSNLQTEHDSYLESIEQKSDRMILKDWNSEYILIHLSGNIIKIYTRLSYKTLKHLLNTT